MPITDATSPNEDSISGNAISADCSVAPRGSACEHAQRLRRQGGRYGQGSHHRSDVGLEDVGAHPRHVPDVVAHVVGNHSRVAGIVLRDAGLHFSDQVRADVSRLGVDAAPHAREQGDRAGAHRKAIDVDRLLDPGKHLSENTDSEQSQPGHRQSHHGPTAEGNHQGAAHPLLPSGLGRTRVSPGRRLHPDQARQNRAGRTADEADRRLRIQFPQDQRRHDGHEDEQNSILALEERHGAGADEIGKLLHPLVARRASIIDRVDNSRANQPA